MLLLLKVQLHVYYKHQVLEKFEVEKVKNTPWFDEPGGGIQYMSKKTIKQLIKDGIIKEF